MIAVAKVRSRYGKERAACPRYAAYSACIVLLLEKGLVSINLSDLAQAAGKYLCSKHSKTLVLFGVKEALVSLPGELSIQFGVWLGNARATDIVTDIMSMNWISTFAHATYIFSLSFVKPLMNCKDVPLPLSWVNKRRGAGKCKVCALPTVVFSFARPIETFFWYWGRVLLWQAH